MKKGFFKYIILFLLFMFISNNCIFAFTVYQVGDTKKDSLGYGLPLKMADTDDDGQNDTVVICTDYYSSVPHGKSCSINENSNWSPAVRYGVATIIELATGINSTEVTEDYFAAEMAINVFLKQKGVGASSLEGENLANGYSVNGTYYTKYNSYLSAAESAYNLYPSSKEDFISLSNNELTFTRQGNNYVSNSIEVTSIVGETYGVQITPNIGNVTKENNKFYITIPVTSITTDTNITVKVISNSKSYSQAYDYSCGSGNQSVTPLTLYKNELFDEDEISGTIIPKGKIIINKTDSNNNPLVGAQILVTGASTGYNKTFITDGNPIILTDLDNDKYTIEEEIAPSGYQKASPQEVTISSTNLEQTVNLIDNILKISILKVDESGKVLPGATLKLTDDKGETLKICGQLKNSECRWKTTEEEYIIEKIPTGTYYIREVSAPDTYDVLKDSIKVIVTSDGLVTVNGKDIKGEAIKFVNKKTRTEISKVSAVDGKELPGATIEILDANKEKMSCVILNNKGKKETLKECSWVSGEESTIIVGLSKGKYYMKETIAPEGYVLNEEMVEFEVKADGTVNKATMKNELEVVVPDTLSARSTLLIAISMFDIALGIGILTYVKKNKAEE